MPFQIVEELRTHNSNIILNSLEEAQNVLIWDNWTKEETLEFLDNNGWDIWFNNRESLLNTINSVVLEWNQEDQVLTRTLVFENEELFDEYRYMCNNIFPAHERDLTVKEAVDL